MATRKTIRKLTPPIVDSAPPFAFETKDVPLTKLLLDPNNYRFLDHKKFKKKVSTRFHEDTVQRATLENLEYHYQLDELKNSILVNGYVPMERIIVTPYAKVPGFFLVVEGNRRVAALKSLINDSREGALKLSAERIKSLAKVPCAILQSSGGELKHAERVIMGIRHIAGPKEWGAYQQALLVSELKDEELLEFKEIGEMLGVSAVEAARRYRAVNALKFMENDELFGTKAEPAFYRLFHELVSTPVVREHFGWDHEKTTFNDVGKAHEFFRLITSDSAEEPKLTTYNDVRRLKLIISNPLAIESLLDPDQTLLQAIRIAEEGKSSTSASDVLAAIMSMLSGIGVPQIQELESKDLANIEGIISTLDGFKSLIPKQK